jgi:hypothetical protein
LWGYDPGVEIYGALGKWSYVVAVQNGGGDGVQDDNDDKSGPGASVLIQTIIGISA